jgi:hypothetical protein
MMYREMYWTSEGYLWKVVQKGPVDMEQLEKDFTSIHGNTLLSTS